MKGLINFSLITIAKLLSIEHSSIISALLGWSKMDTFFYFYSWIIGLLTVFMVCIPIVYVIGGIPQMVADNPVLERVIILSLLALTVPLIVLLISPILPLFLPLVILLVYPEMKKILFPKPLPKPLKRGASHFEYR